MTLADTIRAEFERVLLWHYGGARVDELPNVLDALMRVLNDSEPDHVAMVGDETWEVEHPLSERLNGHIFDCQIGAEVGYYLSELDEGERYRVRRHGVASTVSFEKIDP